MGNDAQIYYPLFGHAWETVRSGHMVRSRDILQKSGQGTQMAIYEINLHAITGGAPANLRNDFLTGLGGGLALPLTMLTYQRDMGIRTQAAFQSLQYSTRIPSGQYGRVWGMLRDIEVTSRKRPTWMGVELANRAIQGNMIKTDQSGGNPIITQAPINGLSSQTTFPLVQSFAFKQGNRYSAVLFNLDLGRVQTAQIRMPRTPNGNATLHTMTANSIRANNENGQQVNIQSQQIGISQNYSLQMSPHSLYVLEWTMN